MGIFFINLIFVKSIFALQISEIMYDPAGSDTGNEWIELYNDTSSSINLTTYKFFENNVNHGITANQGGSSISAGEYVVLADNPTNFLAQHAGYVGKIFDSAFSLSNTGEYIEMRDSASVNLSSTAYAPLSDANGTGGTLNYIAGATSTWQVFIESPGVVSPQNAVQNNSANATSSNSTSTSSATTTSSSTTDTTTNTGATNFYSSGYTNKTYTLGDLNMLTPKEVWTVAGANTYFFVKPIDSKKNTVPSNTYWSFGDGAEGLGSTTTHRYYNAGYYTAFVESEISNAYGVERIAVNVASPDISISEVGEGYIIIKNNSSTELNIGGFIIGSDQGFFKLSRHLILKENSELKIDGRVMGFTNLTNPKILSSDMANISVYKNKANINQEIKPETPNATSTLQINKKVILSKNYLYKNNQYKKDLKSKEKSTSSVVSFAANITPPVDTTPIKKVKNWLYWLYE